MSSIIRIAILAEARNAVRAFRTTGDAAEKMGKRTKGAFKGIAVGLGVTGALAAIGTALKTGVTEAGAFQDATNAANAALATNKALSGLTAKQIQASAAALETLTGAKIDENDATLAANKLIRAGVGSQALLNRSLRTAADVALATKKDLSSVATALSKALANPAKAAGVLGKAGVVLSASQQNTIKAMVKTGNAAGAQAAVLDALQSKYKGAAEAAGKGFTADLGRAKDALSDAERDITTAVLPTLGKLATSFAKGLPAAIEKLKPAINVVARFVSNPAFPKWVVIILSIVAALKIFNVIMAVTNVIMTANPVGAIVVAVVALVAVIVLLATKTRFFQTVWGAVWGFVKTVGLAIGRFFRSLWNSVWGFIVGVGKAVGNLVSFFGNLPGRIVRGLVNGLKSAWHAVTEWFGKAVDLIPSGIRKILGISSPSKVMANIGRNITRGLVVGIRGQLPVLRRTLGEVSRTVQTGVSGRASVSAVAGGVGTVPVTAARQAGTVYAITVKADAADPAEVGKRVVKAIEALERQTGRKRLVTA